jgi:hypothetical protein
MGLEHNVIRIWILALNRQEVDLDLCKHHTWESGGMPRTTCRLF